MTYHLEVQQTHPKNCSLPKKSKIIKKTYLYFYKRLCEATKQKWKKKQDKEYIINEIDAKRKKEIDRNEFNSLIEVSLI